MKEMFDKVVFTLVATLLSTYVLYGYSVYNKAFESAQAQSHSFSNIASKLYSLVVTDTSVAVGQVQNNFLSGADELPKAQRAELERISYEIRFAASVLQSAYHSPSDKPISRKLPPDIALEIERLLRTHAFSLGLKAGFKNEALKKFVDDVTVQQKEFVGSYHANLGDFLSRELQSFEKSFNESLPWYAKPIFVFIVAAAGIGLYMAFVFVSHLLKKDRNYT